MTTLTILCENTALPSLGTLGEHGFSVLIEVPDSTWLFDTGQGQTIGHNARILKKDLQAVSKIILSHGHYDHTGGLTAVLEQTGPVDLYGHPDIFTERFAASTAGSSAVRPVGIPHTREHLEYLGAQFHATTTFTEIAPDLYATGEIPQKTTFEKNDPRLLIKRADSSVPDPLRDDQSLIIKTEKGLTVVLGCAHSGMINTLMHVQDCLPNDPIHMVVGGTHLGFLDSAQISRTISALAPFGIARIGLSHCTGLTAAAALKTALGDEVFFANAGTVIKI